MQDQLSIKNKQEFIEDLFRTIYRIDSLSDSLVLNRASKGFSFDIIKHPLRYEPDDVIVDDFMKIRNYQKYDMIITNNLIDFVGNKEYFLKKARELLSKEGCIEVSSYCETTQKMIESFCRNKKTFLGRGVFFKQYKDCFIYIQKPIYLGETTYILKRNDL
jgi:hypothetical protein